MIRSIKDLLGCPLLAEDGAKAGKVNDVLFGDRHWRMRYIDVETRVGFRINLRYLSDESYETERPTRYLLEPAVLSEPKLGVDRLDFRTQLSRDEVKQCPPFGSQLPVEDKLEEEFKTFLGHGIYDARPHVAVPPGSVEYLPPLSAYDHSDEELREHLNRVREISSEHMHSARAVIGYQVIGSDGPLGAVSDLILNCEAWRIEHFVLDTRRGVPSRKHLIGMEHVRQLDWSRSSMTVDLPRESVANERRFWHREAVNSDGKREYDYYGKPCQK